MTDLLQAGTHAPDFVLRATGGRPIALSDFAGRKHAVLVFYVGDNTPD